MIQEYSLRKEEVHSLLRTKFPNLSKSTSGTSLWKLLKRSALVFHCNLLKYKTVSPCQLWNWFQDSVFFWMNVISWVKINWCREGGCGKQHIGKQKGEQSFTFSTFTKFRKLQNYILKYDQDYPPSNLNSIWKYITKYFLYTSETQNISFWCI